MLQLLRLLWLRKHLNQKCSSPIVTLGKNAPSITCLSYHAPHHSTVASLIPQKYKNRMSLCLSCNSGPLS